MFTPLTFEALPADDPFSPTVDFVYKDVFVGTLGLSLRNNGRFPVSITEIWMFPARPLASGASLLVLLKQDAVLIENISRSLRGS